MLFSGCPQPTYPASRVIQSVKELCKDEYNLDVEARLLGTTLGVSIPVEGLVDKELKLDKEAAKKIEDVALSMRRVILSSDRQIDFYIVCAQDTKMLGAQYVMTSNIMDIKRAAYLDISREEYLSRIQRDFRLNPRIWGEVRLRNLFGELNSNNNLPEFVLAKYAQFPVSTEGIRQIFYPTILIAQPQSINYQILTLESKEISANEALFWIKVKETYAPRPEAEKGAALFPPGFVNEYLIWLNTNPAGPIIEIVPIFFEQENSIRKRNMQESFENSIDLNVLDSQGLPIKEIVLKEFLAKQVARRLKEKLNNERPFKEKFKVGEVQAAFTDEVLKLNFQIEGDEKEVFRQALMMAAFVTRGYWVEDFAAIEVTSIKSAKTLRLSKERLEQFRRKKITINDLLF